MEIECISFGVSIVALIVSILAYVKSVIACRKAKYAYDRKKREAGLVEGFWKKIKDFNERSGK